ncbi:MAG: HEAT repeat domain-containing protein [Verrucomicrobiota bacterium]
MTARKKWILLFGCALLALWVALADRGNSQPSYKGRTLREWAMIRAFSHPENLVADAEEAICNTGTNGIPTALGWVSYNPAESRINSFRWKLSRLPLPQVLNDALLRPFHEQERLGYCIDVVFYLLNTNAASAIPALAQIAKTNRDVVVAERAVRALWRIGPQTIPELVGIIEDTNSFARADAVYKLGLIQHQRHDPAVASLFLKSAQDPDANVSANAVEWLGRMSTPVQDAIPVLIAALRSSHPLTRVEAARALAQYGAGALPAVPQLEVNLHDLDFLVRIEAAMALGKIAPERFTKAPDQILKLYTPEPAAPR